MRLPGGQLHLFRRLHKPEPPAPAPEFATCCALADALRISASPDWWWAHYPAGEARSAITGARLKRMGTKAGVSDYLFCSPDGRLHCLEMKRRRGRLSLAQEDFANWCHEHGVPHAVARSFDEAIATLTAWGVLARKIRPQ